jgi:hypothetical protein
MASIKIIVTEGPGQRELELAVFDRKVKSHKKELIREVVFQVILAPANPFNLGIAGNIERIGAEISRYGDHKKLGIVVDGEMKAVYITATGWWEIEELKREYFIQRNLEIYFHGLYSPQNRRGEFVLSHKSWMQE